MIDKNELVVLTNGYPVLSEKVEVVLDDLDKQKQLLADTESDIRTKLLDCMTENELFTCKVGKYTISQVLGKDTVIFDVDSFLEKENEDIILAFSHVEPKAQEFDLERFKAEQPKMYEKYLTDEDEIVVDTKGLEKAMPNVYSKYVTVVKSEKKPTIRITKAKEKKE